MLGIEPVDELQLLKLHIVGHALARFEIQDRWAIGA